MAGITFRPVTPTEAVVRPLIEGPDTGPSQSAVAAAAWRRENIAVSAREWFAAEDQFEAVEGYDPFTELEDEYLPFYDSFLASRSPEQTQAIRAKIDQEIQDRRTVHDAGASGMLWTIAAGVTDPVSLAMMLVPGGVLLRAGATTGRIAGTTAAFAATEAAAVEVGLQATQETRTATESAFNIMGAAVLGGVVGGAIGLRADVHAKAMDEFSEEMRVIRENDGLSEIPEQGDALSVGAAARVGTLEEEGADIVGPKFSPQTRVLGKSQSPTFRNAMNSMTEHNYYVGKNRVINPDGTETYRAAEAPVESKIKRIQNGAISVYTRALVDNYKAFKKTDAPAMSYREFREAVGRALSNNEESAIPQVVNAAKLVRGILNKYTRRMQEAGQLPEHLGKPIGAASYFPRVYNFRYLRENESEFVELIKNKFRTPETTDDELVSIAHSVLSNIRNTPDGIIPRNIVPESGFTKERVLTLSDEELDAFLVKDVDEVMTQWLRSTVPDMLMRERFGDSNMQALLDMGRSEYEVRIARATSNKEKARLRDQMEQDVVDLRNTRDLLLGNMRPPADEAKRFTQLAQLARKATFMAQLGGVVLSSVPDIGRAVMQHGFGNFARALGPAFSKFNAQIRLQKNIMRDAGIATELLNSTRLMQMADLQDSKGAVTRAFVKVSLMDRWNTGMKQIAAFTGQNRFIRDIRRYDSLSPRRKEALAKAGFGEDVIERMSRELDDHAENIRGSRLANSQNWADQTLAEQFELAILRDVENTIVTPSVADVPLFMNSELGKTMMQFRTFMMAAHNKVFLPMIQQSKRFDKNVLEGLSVMVGMGMFVEMTYMHLTGRAENLEDYTWQNWLKAGLDRSGIATVPFEIYNIADRMASHSNMGSFSAMMGMTESSRSWRKNTAAIALGPTGGFLDRGRQTLYSAAEGELSESDVRRVRRMLPFQNIFYLRWLFDAAEEKVAEEL